MSQQRKRKTKSMLDFYK